jgi:hypothetical protein
MSGRAGPRRIASAAIVIVAILESCMAPAATVRATYRCAGERFFTVDRTSSNAIVHYAERRFELARRPSSVGQKYASTSATLIVDGDFAVFVADHVLDLQACRQSVDRRL